MEQQKDDLPKTSGKGTNSWVDLQPLWDMKKTNTQMRTMVLEYESLHLP